MHTSVCTVYTQPNRDEGPLLELIITLVLLCLPGCEWRNLSPDRWFQFNSHPLNLFTIHQGEISYRLCFLCQFNHHWCHIKNDLFVLFRAALFRSSQFSERQWEHLEWFAFRAWIKGWGLTVSSAWTLPSAAMLMWKVQAGQLFCRSDCWSRIFTNISFSLNLCPLQAQGCAILLHMPLLYPQWLCIGHILL